jgi:hypothetical protein
LECRLECGKRARRTLRRVPGALRVTMSPEVSQMSIPGGKLTLIGREAKRRKITLTVRKDD